MRRAIGIALTGVALTLVAFMFDASPLFVPGVGFFLLGTVAPTWVALSTLGASIDRRLDADRVVEGEPLEATVEIRRSRLGLPGGTVLDPLARSPVRIDHAGSVFSRTRTVQVEVVAHFPRRGLLRLSPPRLVVSDALDLAHLVKTSDAPATDVLVLPRTEPVQWSAMRGGGRAVASSAPTQSEPFAAVDVDGLRPYRPGTPASRIHWPALARGAGLLERRLQSDGEMRPLVVLDSRGNGPAEHLDAAVRAAASLVLELARRGGCGLLLPGDRRAIVIEPDLFAWSAAHARLALVEGGPRIPPPTLGGGSRPGPVIYVAAAPLERLPAGIAGVGSGARALVLPKECSGRTNAAPSFEVAGCYGFAMRTGRGFAQRRRTAA